MNIIHFLKKPTLCVFALLGLISAASVHAQVTHTPPHMGDPLSSVTSKSFTLHLINGKVAPMESLIRVTQGNSVEINVQSDFPGELHLHAYRLKLPISDNNAQQLSFKANASGKFQIEWHPKHNQTSDSQHQDNPAHHGPPLASLEVMPQ
jgi:hypothetical protein